VQTFGVGLGEALDRPELVPVGLHREDDAGADGLAVEQDRARPAHTLLAAEMEAGEACLTERVGERPMLGYVERRVRPVDSAPHSHSWCKIPRLP
jgi:hypothetical protein